MRREGPPGSIAGRRGVVWELEPGLYLALGGLCVCVGVVLGAVRLYRRFHDVFYMLEAVFFGVYRCLLVWVGCGFGCSGVILAS